MKLYELQLNQEAKYNAQQTWDMFEAAATPEYIEAFGGDSQFAISLAITLLESGKEDILLQNYLSRMLGLLNLKPTTENFALVFNKTEQYAENGYYDVHLKGHYGFLVPRFRVSADMRKKLNSHMYMPPMLVTPIKWSASPTESGNLRYKGGYFTHKLPPVLGWKNNHNNKVAVDALNILQGIPFTMDNFILFNCRDTVASYNLNMEQETEVAATLMDKEFYFVWQFDKRGRMYSHGYHMDVQSREYKKALLNFANKEKLTADGEEGLLIHLANVMGHDKLTWDERLEIASDFIAPIAQAYSNGEEVTLDLNEFDQFDEPISVLKAVKAYIDGVCDDLPVGIPCSFDATTSGIQIMSALSGCLSGGELTNIVKTGKRKDAYTAVTKQVNLVSGSDVEVSRADGKQALMTHYYCSVKTPQMIFNPEQLAAFYQVTSNIFTGAEYVMKEIVDHWVDKEVFSWTLPDGHTAYVPMFNKMSQDMTWHGTTFTYEFWEAGATNNYRHLPANIIHSIDAYICRRMVRGARDLGYELVCNHDCFQCHPNYWKTTCEMYRQILAEIADSDILQDIIREITGDNTYVFNKLIPNMSEYILESEYALS